MQPPPPLALSWNAVVTIHVAAADVDDGQVVHLHKAPIVLRRQPNSNCCNCRIVSVVVHGFVAAADRLPLNVECHHHWHLHWTDNWPFAGDEPQKNETYKIPDYSSLYDPSGSCPPSAALMTQLIVGIPTQGGALSQKANAKLSNPQTALRNNRSSKIKLTI